MRTQRIERLPGEFQLTKEANKLYGTMVKKTLPEKEKSKRPIAKIEEEIKQFEMRLKTLKTTLQIETLTLIHFIARRLAI